MSSIDNKTFRAIVAKIRQRDHDLLIRLARAEGPRCGVAWGSHACLRPPGHRGDHWCCCHCRGLIRHLLKFRSTGCVGRWPYYGSVLGGRR